MELPASNNNAMAERECMLMIYGIDIDVRVG